MFDVTYFKNYKLARMPIGKTGWLMAEIWWAFISCLSAALCRQEGCPKIYFPYAHMQHVHRASSYPWCIACILVIQRVDHHGLARCSFLLQGSRRSFEAVGEKQQRYLVSDRVHFLYCATLLHNTGSLCWNLVHVVSVAYCDNPFMAAEHMDEQNTKG